MTFYLDASVIVPSLITEKTSSSVEKFLQQLDDLPAVSELAAGEVASAIARRWRVGDYERLLADRILARLDEWRDDECVSLEIEPVDVRQAADFIRRFDLGLRMPDAIHAATCDRLGLTLVTFDKALARAAQALGIATETLA